MAHCVVYSSKYGATRRYAEALAERTAVRAVPVEDLVTLAGFSTVMYLGGVYSGAVRRLRETFGRCAPAAGTRVIVASIGISDAPESDERAALRSEIEAGLPPHLHAGLAHVHLCGALDARVLSVRDRMLMSVVHTSMRAKPAHRRSIVEQKVVDGYPEPLDFIDLDGLGEIERLIEPFA